MEFLPPVKKRPRIGRKTGERTIAVTNQIIITAAILLALVLASWRFNRYVDSRPVAARADGETALWVVAGCTYVVLAASILIGAWAPWLPADWRLGPACGLLIFAAFIAAGLPMALGDHRRSASERRTNEALDRATQHLPAARSTASQL
jgi:drug/metabolite transporter (DMT)-like permease